MPLRNQGTIGSFFIQQQINPDATDIISTQVDPAQPSVDGLVAVTDPLVPDRLITERLSHMDPSLYDLRDSSHLMRLLRALLGAAGTGGLRKQIMLLRASDTLAGTNFLALDQFWGTLFGLTRMSNEALPLNSDGTVFDACTTAADPDTWDSIASVDGRYRSRIAAFARGVAQGGTVLGLSTAAAAVLGVDVDLQESWQIADMGSDGSDVGSDLQLNTWFMVGSQYPTWAALRGRSWGSLRMSVTAPSAVLSTVPFGNRGEIVVHPREQVSAEEAAQAQSALRILIPAGTMLTVLTGASGPKAIVTPSSVSADSENWDVVSRTTPVPGLDTVAGLYPAMGTAGLDLRTAFGSYAGESVNVNARVVQVISYALDSESDGDVDGPGGEVDEVPVNNDDAQTVTFLDGTRHTYIAGDAMVSTLSIQSARLASEGVSSAFPLLGSLL